MSSAVEIVETRCATMTTAASLRVRARAQPAGGRRWRGRAPRTSRRTRRCRAGGSARARSTAAGAAHPTRWCRPARCGRRARRASRATKSAACATSSAVHISSSVASGLPNSQVAAHRAREQVRPLGHVADRAPQHVGIEVAHVDAADEHVALGAVEQSQDEVDERGLARAGAPDDRGGLARTRSRTRCRPAPRARRPGS